MYILCDSSALCFIMFLLRMDILQKIYNLLQLFKKEKCFSNVIVEKVEYIELIRKSAPVYNIVYWNNFFNFNISIQNV